MLRLDHLGPSDHEPLGEPRTHGLGDVGHRFEPGHATVIEPVEHLLGAQLGRLGVEAGFGEQLGDLDPAPVTSRAIEDPVDQGPAVCDRAYARIERCVAELARAVAGVESPSGAA